MNLSRIRFSAAMISLGAWLAMGAATQAATSDAVNQAKRRLPPRRTANSGWPGRSGSSKPTRLMKASELTPQWQKAAAGAQGRRKHITVMAVKAVRTALLSNEDYKAAVAGRTKALEKREALRNDPAATPEQRTDAAIAVLTASSAVSKIEQRTLADDPGVSQAQSAVDQAQFVLDELRKAAAVEASKRPGVPGKARQKVDAAAAQVAQANQQVAEARKQQAITDEQNLDQEIESKKNSIFGNNRR